MLYENQILYMLATVRTLAKLTHPLQRRAVSLVTYKTFLQQQSQFASKYYSTESLEQRYKDKLLQKAKEQGFNSIEELKDHLKEEINRKKKELSKIDPLKELEDYEQRIKMSQNNAAATKPRDPIDPKSPKVPFKTLDFFLKVEKIKDLSKQEVEFLWRARWANKENTLSAVVPNSVFEKLNKNARENPVFVLPLPREIDAADADKKDGKDQGMELHYIQWQFIGPKTVHCIITSLAEYKLHNEYARPHTTFQFHLELAQDKGIVFMNGHVEPETNVSMADAQLLLLNIQRFFGAMGEETFAAKQRVKLLRDFTKGSPDFNVDLLISLAQSMEN